jgi:hypothetical protein
LAFQILELTVLCKPNSQIKWIFPSMMAEINSLIFFMTYSHAKMAPDTEHRLRKATGNDHRANKDKIAKAGHTRESLR